MRNKNTWMLVWGLAACGIALVAGREFYKRSVAPLRQQEPEILRVVADLSGRIEGAKSAIAEIHAQREAEENAESEWDQLPYDARDTVSLRSVPAVLNKHFSRPGLDAPAIRRMVTEDAPDISGYERSTWLVTVPLDKDAQKIASLLRATEAVDTRGSSFMVRDFTIWPDPEDSARRRGTIHVSVLSKKEETSR